MEQALEQRLREVLGDLPPEDVYAIVAFAQFLLDRRQVERETLSHGSFRRQNIPGFYAYLMGLRHSPLKQVLR